MTVSLLLGCHRITTNYQWYWLVFDCCLIIVWWLFDVHYYLSIILYRLLIISICSLVIILFNCKWFQLLSNDLIFLFLKLLWKMTIENLKHDKRLRYTHFINFLLLFFFFSILVTFMKYSLDYQSDCHLMTFLSQ